MNSFRKLKSLIGDEHISGKFNLPWNLDFLPEIGTLILVPDDGRLRSGNVY